MASKMSMVLMDKFCNEMSTIIDKEQKVTHESLAHKIEAKLDDPKVWNGSNLGKEVRRLDVFHLLFERFRNMTELV